MAILHHPDSEVTSPQPLAGREFGRRFGGVGTFEFAAAARGARLGISTGSAQSLMTGALDLAIRLPQL